MMQETLSPSGADTGTPQPACSASGPGTQHWRTTTYTEQLAGFFDPCTDCFPTGDVELGSRVVRSCGCPNALHRLRGNSASEGPESTDEDAIPEPTIESDGGENSRFEDCNPIPIESITVFQRGDGIVWPDVTSPLVVEQPTTDPDGILQLTGPTGTEYSLQGRPAMVVSYAIYPSYGLVEEIYRLPASSSSSSPSSTPTPEDIVEFSV